MRKYRIYTYYGYGYEIKYGSFSKKGSRENYNDLLLEAKIHYGRYNNVEKYEKFNWNKVYLEA